MEPITTALRLLKRQSELEYGLQQRGGIRVNEEGELYALRLQLERYPHAVEAILQTSSNLHRPIDELSVDDVQRCA